MLSDFFPHGRAAQLYGVLRPEGYSERAIFIVDRDGFIRLIDVHDIDDQPDNEALFRVLAGLSPAAAPGMYAPGVRAEELPPAGPASDPEPQGEVVLYCTSWCPDCRRARAYLSERGIPFVEVDITRNREAARLVRVWANGYETTPTFKVGDQVIVSFNKKKVAEALGIEE